MQTTHLTPGARCLRSISRKLVTVLLPFAVITGSQPARVEAGPLVVAAPVVAIGLGSKAVVGGTAAILAGRAALAAGGAVAFEAGLVAATALGTAGAVLGVHEIALGRGLVATGHVLATAGVIDHVGGVAVARAASLPLILQGKALAHKTAVVGGVLVPVIAAAVILDN